MEFANVVYKGREGIEMIMEYVTGPLLVPYFVLQFSIGAVVPIAMLSYMIWRGTTGKALDRGRDGQRVAGAVPGLDDALERGHRRPGNREDRQEDC